MMSDDYVATLLTVSYPYLYEVKTYTKLEGREEEIQLLVESLHKKRMKNTVLVGPAGCGKTAIIEELAYRVKDEFIILSLDLTGMVAGTELRGQFEKNVDECLRSVREYNKEHIKKIVLFIDEAHMMCSMGQCRESDTATLGGMIKPYLASGEIIIVGATTPEEYEKTIAKDSALKRRVSPIYIKVLGENTVMKILQKFCGRKINNQLLTYIYDSTSKNNLGTQPDISIEVLDRCMARKECTGVEVDESMIDNIINYMGGKEDEKGNYGF